MKTIIRAALVAPKNTIPADSQAVFESNHILLTHFSLLTDLKNSEYFDVILVHEAFLQEYRLMPKVTSSVIILAEEKTSITDLLPRISDVQYFTVLAMPVSSDDIVRQIRKAFEQARDKKITQVSEQTSGKTIAVTSFANGVGKTFVSYNISHKLALFLPDNMVSLTDMNYPLSTAKAMLNMEESYSWNTIRPVLKEGLVNSTKIGNIVYPTPYRFQLLGGPISYLENKPLSDREFGNLVHSLNEFYSVNVIDLPTIGDTDSLKRLRNVDTILIVLDDTGNSILQTKRGLEMMHEHSPELMEKTRFVVNKVDESYGKTAELIASRFRIDVFSAIDDDPEAVRSHSDAGKLFQDKTLLIDAQLYQLAEKLIRIVL